MPPLRHGLVLLTLTFLPGCFSPSGWIYSNTIEPLDTNYDRTPVAPVDGPQGKGGIYRLRYQASVEWNSNGLGDLAQKLGFTKLYYADLERLSILGGLFSSTFVHLYGEKAGDSSSFD